MHRSIKLLLRAAVVGLLGWQVLPFQGPIAVHAATCTANPALPADITPSGSFDTPAAIVATFDNARAKEGCYVPLSINQSTYASESPVMQMLDLINAERRDRGLPTTQLDTGLLTQIALNHGREQMQYKYGNHTSPINRPMLYSNAIIDRIADNPAVAGHWTAMGENDAWGFTTIASLVFNWVYQDSAWSWGHRHNTLGYTQGSFGNYNWVGIGIQPQPGNAYGTQFIADFVQSNASGYTPPTAADTTPPSLSLPVVISGSTAAGGTVTVQASNVQDSGARPGEQGITTVAFYANSVNVVGTAGTSNVVQGTETGSNVWTATLTGVPAGATIHAVAVDGDGNYTDCAAGTGFCGPSVPANSLITITPVAGIPSASVTVVGSGFSAGETVNLYLDNATGTPAAQLTASAAGTITTSGTLPAAAYGPHTLTAIGASSGHRASGVFQIRPLAVLTSSSASAGGKDSLYGIGFTPGETPQIMWGSPSGTRLAWRGADATGTAGPINFTVPSVAPGTYTLYVVGTYGHTTAVQLVVL